MNKEKLLRVLFCLTLISLYFYQVIQKQNQINYLSLQIPKLNKDLKTLEEEHLNLQFAIDCFESPDHLLELLKKNEFSHLKYPTVKDVVAFAEGMALDCKKEVASKNFRRDKTDPVLAVGANRK
jgi:hypothetical protein